MIEWWTVLAMGAGVYGLRLAGFVAPVSALPHRWKRALRILPVALLAALVASSNAGPGSGDLARAIAVIVAGIVAWRFRQIWLVIATGLAVFWSMHWLGWGG